MLLHDVAIIDQRASPILKAPLLSCRAAAPLPPPSARHRAMPRAVSLGSRFASAAGIKLARKSGDCLSTNFRALARTNRPTRTPFGKARGETETGARKQGCVYFLIAREMTANRARLTRPLSGAAKTQLSESTFRYTLDGSDDSVRRNSLAFA